MKRQNRPKETVFNILYSPDNKYIMKSSFAIFLSIIAIIFSIIAICLSWEGLGFSEIDVVGIVIGVAGLIVTVTIGWQIYNVFQMNDLVKEIDRRMDDKINDYEHTVNALLMQLFTINNQHNNNLFTEAIDGYINAIEEALKGSKQDVIDGILHSILEIKPVHEAREGEKKFNVLLYKGKREHYISVLKKIRSKDAKAVEEFIASVKEQGE